MLRAIQAEEEKATFREDLTGLIAADLQLMPTSATGLEARSDVTRAFQNESRHPLPGAELFNSLGF